MATIWNTADKSANVTLSGGSLTAAFSSASQGGVRATASQSTGKWYWEAVFTVTPAGGNTGVGWANATASLASFFGTDKNGVAEFPNSGTGGAIFFNNGNIGSVGGAVSIGTISIAIDFTAKLVWARYNGGLWNNSSTADPATGTGGYSISTINAGPYFPCFGANSSGQTVVANFGATDFNYPVPSGFSQFDTNAQAYNASSKFLGYDLLAPPKTAAVSSKFLGYDLLAPPQTAVVSSKFLGDAILAPPQTAVSASKLIGYAILQPVPMGFGRIDLSWPPPKIRLIRPEYPARPLNLSLYPGTVSDEMVVNMLL
jgi:hypothetical protein